jgi:FkbM family methyltransferase
MNPGASSDRGDLDALWTALAADPGAHAPGTQAFKALEQRAADAFVRCRQTRDGVDHYRAGAFGRPAIAAFQMGAVSSVDIFANLHELIVFAFYLVNRERYRRVADLGANIGLHTVMMSNLGWAVSAYEPDPVHLAQLHHNIALNGLSSVEVRPVAVSDKAGVASFVRVLGNTTSSHLEGAKIGAYGELETLKVETVDVRTILTDADLVKMDVEGHEATLIEALDAPAFETMDMMVEVGSPAIAERVFAHLSGIGVSAFSQKIGWGLARAAADLPANYKEGSLFITRRATMPWGSPTTA